MRKLLILFLLCPLFVQAQNPFSFDSVYNSPVLKFSPLSLLDPLPSVQFALEYQVGRKTSIQHEAGYIINLLYSDPIYQDAEGLRLRNEVRLYFQPKGNRLEGFYFAPELLFIYFEHKRQGILGFGCEDSFGCDYYQDIYFNAQQQVYALHSKIGFQSIYKRLLVDLYTGLGYRYVRVRNRNLHLNLIDVEEEFFDFRKDEGDYHMPSLSLGFKIGYVLNRKQRPF